MAIHQSYYQDFWHQSNYNTDSNLYERNPVFDALGSDMTSQILVVVSSGSILCPQVQQHEREPTEIS